MQPVVNATRMELTRLKNKLVTNTKAHRLLKDKQDELMRQFLLQIESYKTLKLNVEKAWLDVLKTFNKAKIFHYEDELNEKFLVPAITLTPEFSSERVMSVKVPKVIIKDQSEPKLTYSFNSTHPVLDDAVVKMAKLLPDLILLATMDKKNHILIREIEKTKRRVNAIEYILIPEIIENIRIVRNKISDAELSNTVRIMKSKELILKKLEREKEK